MKARTSGSAAPISLTSSSGRPSTTVKARLVATLQGRRNVIDPRCERTKPGINTREVVQATGDFADDAGTRLFPGLTERPISATMMRTKSATMHQGP
jgi:hypothetical protein